MAELIQDDKEATYHLRIQQPSRLSHLGRL